jgi:hypothetical protein
LELQPGGGVAVSTLSYLIHNLELVVRSDSQEFLAHVDGSFGKVYVAMNQGQKNPIHKIVVNFVTKSYRDQHSGRDGYIKTGLNFWRKGSSCLFYLGRVRVDICHEQNCTFVTAQHIRTNQLYRNLRNLAVDSWLESKKDYNSLMKQLIQMPILMTLERKIGISAIHGSSVAVGSSGVVLAGLSSVGKSLLSVALTLDHDAKFLSDNFTLFDGKRIYSFPDYIRLSDDGLTRIQSSGKLGGSHMKKNKRNYYSMPSKYTQVTAEPRALFFVHVSPRPFLSFVTRETALDRILLINSHVREFPEHHHIGLSDMVADKRGSVFHRRFERLNVFLNNIEIFDVGIRECKYPAHEFLETTKSVF